MNWESFSKFMGKQGQFLLTVIVAIFLFGRLIETWNVSINESRELSDLVIKRLDSVEVRVRNLESDIRWNKQQDVINMALICREEIFKGTVACRAIESEYRIIRPTEPESSSPRLP